jgi:hypothetical protein
MKGQAEKIVKVIEIGDKKYKLTFPTIGQATSGDIEYSKSFIGAIKNGILPRIALEKQLRESGVWGEKEEANINSLGSKLQEVMASFIAEEDKSKKSLLREQMELIKNDLLILNMQKQSMFVHTAEAKGEEAKITAVAWQCISNEDGSKVWNSREEFLNESNDENVAKLLQEFIIFTSRMDERANSVDELLEDEEDEIDEAIQVDEEKTETKVEEAKDEVVAS